MNSTSLRSSLALALALAAACDSNDPPPPNPCDVDPASCAATLSEDITANRTLRSDTVYTLGSYVHVTNGAVLTIEPGTVIQGVQESALFILPGARIEANGTADAPIVLTSDQEAGERQPGDWGGLILIGSAQINRSGTIELEGTGEGDAANYPVNYSGGTAAGNTGSSGTLRYVRVEFAGFGPAPNQELNSFTFAAIGSGTTLEYLQSLVGLDDSFEWFGGAADAKYLVSYEAGDDHFDSSEGNSGRNQYLIGYQTKIYDPRAGSGNKSTDPQGFEVDGCGSASGSGCDLGFNSTPLNTPMFANFTMVGTGVNADVQANNAGVGMVLRRGTAGMYVNGIVARWPRAAFSLRDTETQVRFTAGEAILRNVYVAEIGTTAGTNGAAFEAGSGRFTIDAAANNLESAGGTVTAASIFTALPAGQPANAAALDWSLTTGAGPRTGGTGAFTGALATKGGTFVTGTTFRGAWDPSGAKWWAGWTNYAQN